MPKVNLTFEQADIAPPYNVTGSIDIEVDVTRPTPCVVLHAISMDITAVSYTPRSSAPAGGGASSPISGVPNCEL